MSGRRRSTSAGAEAGSDADAVADEDRVRPAGRFLTWSGLGAAIAAVVFAIVGWWWQYEELFVIAVGLAIAVVAAVWSARVAHAARIVRRVSTPRVARGEPLRVRYRVNNQGRRRTNRATLVDSCDGELGVTEVPPVAPKDRTDITATIPTRRRGVHRIGPWYLERHDPFGLAVGRRSSGDTGTVIVHPKVHQLAGPYGAMHIVEHEAVIRRVASDPLSGFVSLREYVQGDDPRLIHWPTTARMGTLMLREHVELRRPEFTVVLDTAASVAPADDFEEMVDVVASIAVHAIRSGVDVTVRTTSKEYPGSRRSIGAEQTVLDLLTPVAQTEGDSILRLSELFRDGLDHTAIVMVTGPDGPASVLPRGDSMSIVRVGQDAALVPGIALAVDDAATFAQKWRPWR
ncbi:MAG: DUF58 domain-containing protein [Ilumatobacter fluminis]|uniref:DUF58 domain-containing protein n=1 Tax=Ilumatobacter fluminis TaxID=467091 RepID=UPI0032ECECBB